MFDVPTHAPAIDPLVSTGPLPAAGIRSLIAASAHDHRYAEIHRKASNNHLARHHQHRAGRISRAAAIAEARATELLAEAR